MTRYENKPKDFKDSMDVIKWLQNNITSINMKTPIKVEINYDGTVRKMEIDKKLSVADKTKITNQFPEIKSKEVTED